MSPLILNISSLMALYVLLIVAWIYYRQLRARPELLIVSWLALGVLFLFLLHKSVWAYTYDLTAHTSTIEYYASHFSIPPETLGGEAHQPPLYYTLAAATYRLAGLFTGGDDQWRVVIDLNFFFFSLFLLYGILSIIFTIKSRWLAFLGTVALLAWPANILHCCRISNDILVYLAFAGCAYHVMRWYKGSDIKQGNFAILWLGVAFATKNSAAILLISLLSLAALTYCRGKNPWGWIGQLRTLSYRKHIKPVRLALLFLLVCMAAGYGRNLYGAMQDQNVSILNGIAASVSFHFVPAEFAFDFGKYLTQPYVTVDLPASRNELFWNFFLRTLSFGETGWNGATQAVILDVLLLTLWGYLIASMLIYRCSLGWAGYFSVFTGWSLIGLAFIKMLFYGHPWADARHIYFITVFFLLACLNMLERQRHANAMLYLCGLALLTGYMGASIVHIALQL